MKQPILKEDEHDEAEADLEYGNQRKAIMDIKAEMASVHFMVSNISAALVGWAMGVIFFAAYCFLAGYGCPHDSMPA